ncbi:thiol reductant ABC exporter subunit CydC [Halobacillus shinanisalinarum]|uniref:Thiol reductant ABC exporter subunit CydC n=1 Tax=Halobacillus shinanisalinarum TaxID=2932258 RepID=A0ABY4GV58_9BACI|nr:thiol reductant ABC exporter subunit CydC [Halobacillus shinanisalinarum]UOQ91595.1 thiol reductant ABC exporter subunit CydC [Halobacillus shinanisalinarum]
MKDLAIVMKLVIREKRDILLSILFGFLAGITAVGLFGASGYLVSKAALTPPLYTLIVVVSIVKLLGFVRAISRYAERYFSHRATFTILSHLRVSFYEKLEPLVPSIFQKYRSGDLLARIVGDVESLQNFFLRVFYPPIVLVIVFLSTIVFTVFYSVSIALVLLGGLLITGFVVPYLFALRQRSIDAQVREERGSLSTESTELLYGFRDLKIYQKLVEKEAQLKRSSGHYIQEQEKEGIHASFSHAMNTMVSLIVSWIVLALGVYLVTEGQLDGIFLAMLVMISLTVFENTTPMAVFPLHLEDSRRASNRLFSVVRNHDGVAKQTSSIQLQGGEAYSIDMQDVNFTFPREARPALENVNLQLPAGSKTAIVGPSGSGKSTLLQLLLKVQTVDSGEIRIGETPLASVEQESLWQNTNVILQENHFFYGTIKENLLIARDDLVDEQLEAALAKVDLDHFNLSDPVLEKGANLSGGEKQRLAMVRAMLKAERLWILDEPTSSVDALTETAIYRHLFEQAKEETLILVSHRLTGLEKMDKIVVIENGNIMEEGTFDELMEKRGYFYEMKQIEKSVFM